MGEIYETKRMLEHIEQCAVCKAATQFAGRCDVWSDMYQNVADFECREGPFEDKPDVVMCEECDGPVLPGDKCPACGAAN